MTKMDKKEIKEKIYLYELNNSGLRQVNGGDVIVKNLRILKRDKIVKADITFIEQDMGDGYSRKEQIKDCEYPFKLLKLK